MMRRALVAVAGSLLVQAAPPNFLLLLPDQWRWDFMPNSTNLAMPVFESLRAAGTVFERAFVASPLCAPSRACLASGREYDLAGVPSNFANDYPVDQPTFYSRLEAAGYHTMTVGKDDLTKATGVSPNGSFHAAALGFTDWDRCAGKDE